MGLLDVGKLMSEYKQVNKLEEGRKLVDKWSAVGLLEGLDTADEFKLIGMARLLENQAKRIIDETSNTGTTANAEAWSDVALPLVRRTFGKIVAQDLMSVQPMSLPSGLVFWLYFNFGTGKPTNSALYTSGVQMHGNVSSSTISGSAMGNLYDWNYSYTKNYVSASSVTVTSATASWSDFHFDSDLSASISAAPGNFKKYTMAWSALTRPDKEAVKAITVSDTAVPTLYQRFFTQDATNAYLIGSGAVDASLSTVEYLQQTTQDWRGDFEAGQSGIGAIPEVDVALRSEAISVNTRKLKAVWTPEIAQDLNAYQSIDAEAELTNVISEFMAMEIDMELLDMLWSNALITDFWSAKVGAYCDSLTGAYVSNAPVFYGTQMEWYQTLIQKLTKVSNEIHKRTLRGGANWIVVGTTIATILESMKPGFIADTQSSESTEYAMGLERVGTLNQKWTVYKNPYFDEHAILMGFRGGSFLETGAAYLPYIPLISTPLLYDPDDFTPRKGIMTRYAKKLLRAEFYGKIIVRDLNLV